MRRKIKELEDAIGIKFKNRSLLMGALTHKSYAIEIKRKSWNERLEFLGDSILSAIIADFLYRKYPKVEEGTLSKLKSQLVSRPTLAQWAKKLSLGEYVFLSSGEESTGGRKRESTLANTFEALLGAVYLEKGYLVAKHFVVENWSKKHLVTDTDYKSQVQEIIQKKYKILPIYHIIREKGPEHEKTFEIEVRIKGNVSGRGSGKTKKDAEQKAAEELLKTLKGRGRT